MNDTLELEPIVSAAPAPVAPLTPTAAAARAVMTVREAALARFTATEIHLTDMATRYKNVAWDCSTPKAMAATKAARLEMREEGRYVIQRLVESTKKELNDLKKDMEAEGERLIAILQPHEEAADTAIKAQEKLDEEAAEQKRKAVANAAARVAGFEAKLNTIKGYPALAEGKPSATIAAGIKYVQGLDVSSETWVEFTPRAVAAKEETLKALDALHLKALADELAAQKQAEALAAAQRQQALVDELGELAAMPAAAKAANTLEALTSAVDRAQAWDMDPTRWGVMHMAAVGTRTGVLTDLAATLQAYSAAVAALAAKPEPEPVAAPAASTGFDDLDEEPDAEPVALPVLTPGSPALVDKADMPQVLPQQQESRIRRSSYFIPLSRVAVVHENAAGEVSEPIVASAPAPMTLEKAREHIKVAELIVSHLPKIAPTKPAVPDLSSEPTLSASAICERFGEGLSMTRAYIENVLRVPADGQSVKKHPLWSERSARAIALALAARATAIAG